MLKATEFYSPADVHDFVKTASAGNEDISCSISEVKFSFESTNLMVEFPSGQKLTALPNAIKYICTETQIPFSYFTKIDEDLALKNLVRRSRDISKERKFRVNTTAGIVRGIVPVSYSDMPNYKPFEKLDPKYKISPIMNLESDQVPVHKSLSWRLVIKELEQDNESKNFLGLALRLSELGGFFSTLPTFYRLVCLNGMVVADNLKKDAYRVSYAGVDDALASGLIRTIMDIWTQKAARFDNKITEKMNKILSHEDAMEIFQNLENQKISKKFIKDMQEDIPAYPINEWDFINKGTLLAQTLPEDNRFQVEHAFGKVSGFTEIYES